MTIRHRAGPLRPGVLVLVFVFVLAVATWLSPVERDTASVGAAGRPEVWFAPYPYGLVGAPWQATFGSTDFKNIFSPSARWTTASSRTGVFQFYQNWLLDAPAGDLKTEVKEVARRGMRIAVESSALQETASCGTGVDGFQRDATAKTLRALKNVKDATGAVAYVALQEPVSFGTTYDGPNACHFTPGEVAEQVASYVAAIRAVYPGVKFGTTEADWTPVASVAEFADAFRRATGSPLAFIHWDADWQRRGDWPQRARSMETESENRGISFGMIYYGNPDATSDTAWLQQAAEHMAMYETLGQGTPAQVIFQSWHRYPTRIMPDTDSSKFANIINRYFNPRSSLTLGISNGRATGTLMRQGRYGSYQGFPGQPLTVTVKPLDGPGQFYEYTISGTVPADATIASAGFRLNIECSCAGTPDFSLYEVRYQEAGGPNKVTNASFASALNYWGPFGGAEISVVPSDRGPGNMLHARANANAWGGLNSTVFPVSPGKAFKATFAAAVAPSSIGGGYFAVMFAVASGETRPTTPLEAPTKVVKATTNIAGNYSAMLPSPLPPAFELTATYGGSVATWASYARQVVAGPAVAAAARSAPAGEVTLECLPNLDSPGRITSQPGTECEPPRRAR